ncbi:hypothetical protein SODALDRAFT_323460 [Sodiomyces alkalinus F11]|uniref:Uncharacterized protein n=1 Tax=Sodiomyces alkalinus (strain CBS 110278 / VKM F-3762 / F11) TaxID=1314773 RepID=A0A3N2PWS7_SODAK|nr:hypothetical protein SODALDRAFT_323460 [Sodiomyces alkalinus F11]ROT38971.1 hypothetical protein SODALDRAFT_323460 [Sodiomyces alkalinus F11]
MATTAAEDTGLLLQGLNMNQLPTVPKPAAMEPDLNHKSAPEKTMELRRNSSLSTTPSHQADNPFDTDMEAMVSTTSEPYGRRKSAAQDKPDCPTVWPGKQHWKQKAKTAKRSRYACNFFANLSKRNRIIAKVAIILFIVGVAVGVGMGVSKSLNAPIWGDDD